MAVSIRPETNKLSNEIAVFIGQLNRKMRPLSHMKKRDYR